MAKSNRFVHDDDAALSVGRGLTVAGSIIGAVVVILIVASLIPEFLTALGDTNTALSGTSTNDTTADTIKRVMPILVGVGGVFGIVGLILAAMKFRGS